MNRALRLLPAGIFTIVPAILVLGALGSGEFLFGVDFLLTFYYVFGMLGRALAAGRLPLWETSAMGGSPVFAGLQSGALYPPNWLAALLDPGPFWTTTAMLHLSLAGFFAWAWLRKGLKLGPEASLFGGCVYMLSGFVVTHLFAGHVSFVLCYPWAAGLLWRQERLLRGPSAVRAAALAGCLAMMVLAGFPQLVFVAGLALAGRLLHFVLERPEQRKHALRRAGIAAGALLLGTMLAAPQLLPSAELAAQTQRSALGAASFETADALTPSGLVTLFAPSFLGDETRTPYWGQGVLWEICGFVGIATLALAALGACGGGRQRRLWVAIGLLGLLLALGSSTPLFGLFVKLFPGASLFRVPARYLLLFTLAATALAAMGLQRLCAADARVPAHALRVAAAAFLLALLGGGLALRFPGEFWSKRFEGRAERGTPRDSERRLDAASFSREGASALWGATLTLAGTALLLGALRYRPSLSRGLGLGVAALAVAEMLAFDSRYFQSASPESMAWPPKFIAIARNHPQAPFRIASTGVEGLSTIGRCQISGLEHIGGYDPMLLARYADLVNVAMARPLSMPIVLVPGIRPHPIFDLMGVRWWILPRPMKVPDPWISVGQLPDGIVLENPAALPRAFLIGRAVVIPDREERLRFLGQSSFDPRQALVLEEGVPTEAPSAEPGSVRILSRASGRYELECEAASDAWLVLTEAFYPGWTARIGDAPAEIRRADHLVQAIRVPAGKHLVRFEYRSRYLGLGFGLAALSIALLGVSAIVYKRRKRSVP